MIKKLIRLKTPVIFMLVFIISCVYASDELKIREGTPFKKTEFPTVKNPPGPLPGFIAEDWKEISLSGKWKFRQVKFINDKNNPLTDEEIKQGYYREDYDAGGWKTLLVPWSWYLPEPDGSGKRDYVPGKTGWYRRNFGIEEEWMASGRRILLEFSRVANQIDLWVNGAKIGKRKEGRFNSITYDITPAVKPGENVMAVRVYERREKLSITKRSDAKGTLRTIGGIYDSVRLLVTVKFS
jgi:beta-galactosidase/beta-glucuronidase